MLKFKKKIRFFQPKKTQNKQTGDNNDKTPDTPNTRDMKQLREQLEQQSLQTRQALAQLMLVREQLISETNARIEAQVKASKFFRVYSLLYILYFISRQEHNNFYNKIGSYWNISLQ